MNSPEETTGNSKEEEPAAEHESGEPEELDQPDNLQSGDSNETEVKAETFEPDAEADAVELDAEESPAEPELQEASVEQAEPAAESPQEASEPEATEETQEPESHLPDYGPGDIVKVHVRVTEGNRERMQVFEGVVISKRGSQENKTFTVRKISFGVGVERIFPECSPVIAKLEVVSKGDVRRAKLYYIRSRIGKAAKVKQKRDY